MPEARKSPPPASSTLGSTRQLLDELDALMERMLSLPVGDGGEADSQGDAGTATLAAPPAAALTPTPLRASSPTLAPAPAAFSAPVVKKPAAPDESEVTPVAAAETATTPAPPVELPRPLIVSQPARPRPFNVLAESPLSQSPLVGPQIRRRRWWLWPLVAVNYLFDACTYLLGPLGGWLRGGWGRAFLGWVGVLLLLGTLAWQIYQWVGWN